MVFTTTNLFKGIACPQGEQCVLTSCIFSHDLRPAKHEGTNTKAPFNLQQAGPQDSNTSEEPPLKRRKITYDSVADKPPSRADEIWSRLAAVREPHVTGTGPDSLDQNSLLKSLSSIDKPVTPPPTNGRKATSSGSQSGANNSWTNNSKSSDSKATKPAATTEQASTPKETLNPRLISNDPAGHAKRSLYLKHLHGEMGRLNSLVPERQTMGDAQQIVLTVQQLIKLALDEEQKVAKEQPLVYANVIKNRIAAYRKMGMEEWTKHVRAVFEKDTPRIKKEAKPIETGLTAEQECMLLPHLIIDQARLTQYGYIPVPPTAAQAAEAAAAVEASQNFEICERCSSRFQVFPERNEQGKLTSNSPCTHHPNKKVFPQKTRGEVVSGLATSKEPYYPCCGAAVGSPGCTVNVDHVFKASHPARLAAVLPFINTPENEQPAKDRHGKNVAGVTFDCEMGHTTLGMELIRLTAVSWPSGEELIDVLVRPLGVVIDLNSRFSGVWPEQFTKAIPYNQWSTTPPPPPSSSPDPKSASSPLPIVNSPQKARELLCSFLTPSTPLIGHAIDNDLNVVRLCHPSVIDTVILYPHPRGLPIRFGLKALCDQHLGRKIQTGGDRGHDSLEDAQATGDLVRYKIGRKWTLLKASGWKFEGGRLVVPASQLRAGGEADPKELVGALLDKAFNGSAASRKRRKKRTGVDGGGDSTEDEELPLGNGVASYLQRSGEVGEEGKKAT